MPTKYCWSCMFPLKLFGTTKIISDNQEDTDTIGSKPVCTCNRPPAGVKIGTALSFWEPTRMVDVVRTPWCFPLLGGIKIDGGVSDLMFGGPQQPDAAQTAGPKKPRNSFYNVHWYINPITVLASIIADSDCLDNQGFDLMYLSEVDPAWVDSEIENFMEPDAFLFGGFVAQAACSFDCLASSGAVPASQGFGLNSMFWCAGCNGELYPLTGGIQHHVGGVQASSLMVQRTAARMHRLGTQWASTGDAGMCGYYPQLLMDKKLYKYSMAWPAMQGKADGTGNTPSGPVQATLQKAWQGVDALNATVTSGQNRCCQPLGRNTMLWGAGKEIPYVGEDFGYIIYRKRDCCAGGYF